MVCAISVDDGVVVRYVLYERGSVVDEYQSLPEHFGPLPPGDVVALGANPTVVSRLTGAEPARGAGGRAHGLLAGPAAARRTSSCSSSPRCSASRAPGAGRFSFVPTLYTADRCPYAARARIVLAEKGIAYEAVEIDLDDRPAWIYEKNATGRVPVYEEDEGLVLPESEVIMEYLEERYPEPALWPADPAERALGRLWLNRFDDRLGDAYYAARRATGGRSSTRGWPTWRARSRHSRT